MVATFIRRLGFPPRQSVKPFCDSKAACDIARNPIQHDRTKHVEVDCREIRK